MVPYLRSSTSPGRCWSACPGHQRVFLSVLGQWSARWQQAAGLPGNDYLVGVTDPPWVKDPEFFARRLKMTPGNVVELMVHPGHLDETLLGRDCTRSDGQCSAASMNGLLRSRVPRPVPVRPVPPGNRRGMAALPERIVLSA